MWLLLCSVNKRKEKFLWSLCKNSSDENGYLEHHQLVHHRKSICLSSLCKIFWKKVSLIYISSRSTKILMNMKILKNSFGTKSNLQRASRPAIFYFNKIKIKKIKRKSKNKLTGIRNFWEFYKRFNFGPNLKSWFWNDLI